jgi:hypothetical protein
MDENIIVVAKIKAQLAKFSGIISKGFPKAKRRLIKEILYGIQATKDVKLSNISRSLHEQQVLIKTEDRLSRNLDDGDFTDGINHQICRLGGSKVLDEMVIAIDLGDIRKRYARKMEYLAGIRDGSEREVGNGYWLCKCVAADIEHTRVIPLYCEAYSQEAEAVRMPNYSGPLRWWVGILGPGESGPLIGEGIARRYWRSFSIRMLPSVLWFG